MGGGGKELRNLKEGMMVNISLRSDRSGKSLISGVISQVLTKSDYHPHGILVQLESGEVGRVQDILDTTENKMRQEDVTKVLADFKPSTLYSLIQEGESNKVEFKDRALWSTNYTSEDIKNHKPQTKELHLYGQATSKIILAKVLAGFLNTNGGTLIIGIKENKDGAANEIVGIDVEFPVLKDPCVDGYRRMIVDLIKDYFPSSVFNHLDEYFRIYFEIIEGRTVCGVDVFKSDKRVFLKIKGGDFFYIRTDASTRELVGEEVVDYCERRFS